MNKLYCIKFTIKNGYVVSVYNTFSPEDLREKMRKNPEWSYVLIESNNIHDIYKAK